MDDITEYRLYTFGNFYLSSIQQGIQAAHCLGELFLKYTHNTPARETLLDWAEDHKTMICKNGGAQEQLRELIELFDTDNNQYPWSYFEEEEGALNGALTCVAIVVPDTIYDLGTSLARDYQKGLAHYSVDRNEDIFMYAKAGKSYVYNSFEDDLINTIMRSRNAT